MNKLTTFTGHILCISLWFFTGCSSSDEPAPVDCANSNLDVALFTKEPPTTCTSADGLITVVASGGKEPYTYSINTGSFTSSPTFNDLGAGEFTVFVKDKNGCKRSVIVSLAIPGDNSLTATADLTPDTECIGSNGSIQVNASGGLAPYKYTITSTYGDVSLFEGLPPNNYTVSVKDDNGCIFTIGATITQGNTGITYDGDIKILFQSRCDGGGCHPANGDWFTYSTAKSKASEIKSRTQAGTMPPSGGLTAEEKAKIACWVDGGAPQN
jgi:hypothetical protein